VAFKFQPGEKTFLIPFGLKRGYTLFGEGGWEVLIFQNLAQGTSLGGNWVGMKLPGVTRSFEIS